MSRIKIEDLQATETLTPEQEEQIEGAGLRPFRPTLEGLEDRQVMASHLADAPRPAALAGPAVVASATPQVDIMPTSSAPRAQAVSADASFVEAQVRALLKDSIIGNGLANGK